MNIANDFAFAIEVAFIVFALLMGACLLCIVLTAIGKAFDGYIRRRPYNHGVWRISGGHLERPEEKWRRRK